VDDFFDGTKAFALGASKTVQLPKNMTVNFKTLHLVTL